MPTQRHAGFSRSGPGFLVPLLALILAIVALQILHHVPSTNGSGISPLSGFGGYTWSGEVNSISAAWTVPEISASSPPGDASTWIGAQNGDGGFPFIQLGTTEDTSGPATPRLYEAFWSSTSMSFHPQNFLPCFAGDHVTASMQRNAHGWLLRFVDLSQHVHKKLQIYYGANASYSQGEWLQEDPTGSFNAAVDLPYPTMVSTTFHNVHVNGVTPRLTLDDGQTLSATRNVFQVPTAFRNAAFSLVTPVGVRAQLLSDMSPLESATAAFDVSYATWKDQNARSRIVAIEKLVVAYTSTAARVSGQSWPSSAQQDVAPFANELRRQAADIRAWFVNGVDSFVVQNLVNGPANGPWADRLRRSLHLPPL